MKPLPNVFPKHVGSTGFCLIRLVWKVTFLVLKSFQHFLLWRATSIPYTVNLEKFLVASVTPVLH